MKIEVKNVSKKFKKVTVLENINVSFESGNIYGLIGRNGSGKSVFLKLISGLYKPDNGKIIYDGVDIVQAAIIPPYTRALIESASFLPDLTGFENLKLLASIQNIIGEEEIIKTLEKVKLIDEKDKKYRYYSLGMKQKLGIAQVLMENPKVIILDEPFNGIEEATAIEIRKILMEEAKTGKIIIIATHMKEDIEKLSNKLYKFDGNNLKQIK